MAKENQKRALPFEVTSGYVGVPNAVMAHYFYHPKFNGSCLAVYTYLLARHNDEYGYAFPTHEQMAKALVVSDRTVRNALRTLQDVQLIDVSENGPFGNHIYRFLTPVEGAEDFFARFPEAAENKRKKDESWAKITPKREEAKRQWTEKKAEVDGGELPDFDDWL